MDFDQKIEQLKTLLCIVAKQQGTPYIQMKTLLIKTIFLSTWVELTTEKNMPSWNEKA